jgi:hypothetical protein
MFDFERFESKDFAVRRDAVLRGVRGSGDCGGAEGAENGVEGVAGVRGLGERMLKLVKTASTGEGTGESLGVTVVGVDAR